jgi:carboxyl-terminal processing protease
MVRMGRRGVRGAMIRLLAAVLLSAAALGAQELEAAVKTFTDVLAVVEREAAEPVPMARSIYEGAIPGMLRRLDPHSVFLDPMQFEQLKQMERSTQKGFGSVVSVLPGRVIVLQTLPGTPSARSGISPGDEIIAINNIRLDWLDVEQLVQLLSESRQRPVTLDVRRPGNVRVLQFTLTPEELQAPSVERVWMIRPGIGYLRVSSFDEKTGVQIREAIEKLGGAALKGLILDLRNNAGGVVDSALETAALFLKPGATIMSVRGRAVPYEEVKTPEDARPYGFPLAVLVSGKTASAAEIVAGAVQDHDRGVVIGEATYGKGLVQRVMPLSEGAALALTTAYYYTPSGRSIQRPLAGQQLERLVAEAQEREFRTAGGRLVKGGGGIEPDIPVAPESYSPLRAVLDASGAFASFATAFLQKNRNLPESFEVTAQLLDEFQGFLSERNIRPGVGEWSVEREWIGSRLKQEIFNQAFGVERGDEVEAERDPQIQRALAALAQ